MMTKCEITISETSVFVKVQKARQTLRVFIDNVEQNTSKITCKWFHFIELNNTIQL